MTRRLPIYLLLDCSGSMAGEPAAAVRMGLRMFLSDLKNDPLAHDAAWVSLVTFDSVAQQVQPLRPVSEFKIPQVVHGGLSSLSEAYRLAAELVAGGAGNGATQQARDWKPVVFLWTDGQATDNWGDALAQLRHQQPADIIVCGAGPHAQTAVLQQMGDTVLHLEDVRPGTLSHCLKWVAA